MEKLLSSAFIAFAVFVMSVAISDNMLFAQGISVLEEKGTKIHVYNAKLENFAVTSTLLEGKENAVLINAQFSNEEARQLVDMIKKTGKNLTTIYISHHDPDFYFGLAYIAENFPGAKIYSTPQTAYLIDSTKDAKLELWKPQLKDNAPAKFIVPEPINSNYFMLEDTRIEIVQDKEDPDFSYLWIPSLRTVLGGTYLYNQMHVWMADLQLAGTTDKWLGALDNMESLAPKYAIPGHFIMEKSKVDGNDSIKFTRNYIIDFEREKRAVQSSAQLIKAMKALYPGLEGDMMLDIGAKVRKGEMVWEKIDSFPPIARKLEVRFGNNVFELDFKDNKHMSFQGKAGDWKELADDVEYTAIQIAPGIYLVYWSEPVVKSTVVHVEDFNTGTVYTNTTTKEDEFINMKGTISFIE